MVERVLFTFFSRLAQAYVWTKTKAFYQSCNLRFLIISLFFSLTHVINNLSLKGPLQYVHTKHSGWNLFPIAVITRPSVLEA